MDIFYKALIEDKQFPTTSLPSLGDAEERVTQYTQQDDDVIILTIYPFIRYNYVSPSVSIRSVNAGGHSIVSRVLFLFVQYIITFVLIIVSLFFTKQVRFMLSADLNYTTKDIIQCQLYALLSL